MEVLGWILGFLKLCFIALYFISFAGIAYFLTLGNIRLVRAKNSIEFRYRLLYNLVCIFVFGIIIWIGNSIFD